MGRACCVLGCPSGGDVPSHQIPKNPILFKKWKSLIYSEKIQHLTDEQINKCTVCYRHFADDDYLITFRVRKLKRGVAPSLNLPENDLNHEASESQEELEDKPKVTYKNESVPKTVSVLKMEENPKEELEISEIALFEDLPEKLEPRIPTLPEKTFEQMHEQPDTCVEQSASSLIEKDKSNCKVKTLRKKRARYVMEQLVLSRRKKRAELYAKTTTIQKLLALLTSDEKSSVQARIRRSKYSPRVYTRIYHDIAKKWALGQL